MPTLRQLQYLIAVDDERHFGKASQRVNVSQPTLSAQLSTLEHRLNIRLFERDRSGVFPTPIGQEIIARARKIIDEVDELRSFAHRTVNPLAGRLRIGTPPTLGPYILSHIVAELHQSFPDLKLMIREAVPSAVQKMTENGELDVALTPLPILGTRLHSEILFNESLYLGMAGDHPLAQHEYVSEQDLKGEKVLAMVSGHQLHDQVKDLCDQYGANLQYDYEGTSLDALRHMVAMGAGISFFPALYVLSEMKGRSDIITKPLENQTLERSIAMVWRKESHLHDNLLTLANLFKEVSRGIAM